MKYFKRLKIYKASNVSFNPQTCQAYSYGWWRFVDKVKGKVIFNHYRYSNTTSGHQSKVGSLLSELGIKIDFSISLRGGLQTFTYKALPTLYKAIFQHELVINKTRTRETSKAYAKARITELKRDIKTCRALGCKLSKRAIKAIQTEVNDLEAQRLKSLAETRKKDSEVIKLKRKVLKETINNTPDLISLL